MRSTQGEKCPFSGEKDRFDRAFACGVTHPFLGVVPNWFYTISASWPAALFFA